MNYTQEGSFTYGSDLNKVLDFGEMIEWYKILWKLGRAEMHFVHGGDT